jgi:hypothetical protein
MSEIGPTGVNSLDQFYEPLCPNGPTGPIEPVKPIKKSPAFDLWFDLYNSKEVDAVLMMCPDIAKDFDTIYKQFSNTNDWELLYKIIIDGLAEAQETILSNPHNTFISFCRFPSINPTGCLKKFYENTTETWRRSGRYES